MSEGWRYLLHLLGYAAFIGSIMFGVEGQWWGTLVTVLLAVFIIVALMLDDDVKRAERKIARLETPPRDAP